MSKNYKLLVYLSENKLIPYSEQFIQNVEIPDFFEYDKLKFSFNITEKYVIELDNSMLNILSIIKNLDINEWSLDEIKEINLYNRTVIKIDNTKKIKIPIPDNIIIEENTWDTIVNALILGQYPMLLGPTGVGKAQPLTSKILTPTGWINMGKVKVGNKIITQSGETTIITGVYPQGKKEIYKISFSDGSSTECCNEHLWAVKNFLDRNKRRGKKNNRKKINTDFSILQLNEIKENLIYNKTHKNFSIPIVEPIKFNKTKQILDPYFLGLLIGDGGISQKTIHFSSEDKELLDSIESFSKEFDCSFKIDSIKGKHIEGRITPIKRSRNNNKILSELKLLGLMGKKSEYKFIPNIYKYSSIEDRIKMLQGLMDTDGSTTGISTTFSTSSYLLKNDIIELVRSLGGIATYSSKIPKYKYLGKTLEGKKSYNISIKLCNINPFRLKRKAEKYIHKTKYSPIRYITNIEFVGIKEAQCISIKDDSHLYITDDYIVTHNTVLSKTLAKVLNHDFYYINCGSLNKPKQSLVGTIQVKDGTTYLVESEFLKFFKSDKPTIILLDEISRAPLIAEKYLMAATDKEQSYIYVEELGERIYKGKNVLFIATANFGIEYVGTRKLDIAFMDRFIQFILNYLNEENEIKLINNKIPNLNTVDVKKLVKTINLLRKNSESLGRSISHRKSLDLMSFLNMGFNHDEIVDNIISNLYSNGSDDRKDIFEQIILSKK